MGYQFTSKSHRYNDKGSTKQKSDSHYQLNEVPRTYPPPLKYSSDLDLSAMWCDETSCMERNCVTGGDCGLVCDRPMKITARALTCCDHKGSNKEIDTDTGKK